MKNRPYKTWVEVSKSALLANALVLKSAAGRKTTLMSVVKSNAYGHGIAETVRALSKGPTEWFGVDSLREAEQIREAGSNKPVLLLGYTPLSDSARAVKQGFSMTTYNRENVAYLNKIASAKRPAKIHLKLETGTSRQGLTAKELPAFLAYLKKCKNVQLEGLSTHYANIEDTTDPAYALAQLERFLTMLSTVRHAGFPASGGTPQRRGNPLIVHTACSAAVLLYPETHFTMVRAGIAQYGLWPSKETKVSAMQKGRNVVLKPALTWKSIIAQVKSLPAGAPVSYGLTEKLERPSKVAVIPVGYWDGYDRKLSSIGRVLVRGKSAKVMGRVCMNMFVVDVTDIPGVRAEDEVVLIGTQGKETISAEDVASRIGTINYEVVTRINPTLPRILVS